MTPTIKVSQATFERLEKHAQGFDSPENVIVRLLDKADLSTVKTTNTAPKSLPSDFDSARANTKNTATSIESIVSDFWDEYEVELRKIPRKQIMYDGRTTSGNSIIVAMPYSKIHPRGNGWVDLSEVQIELLREYSVAIVIFRLPDELSYYVDFSRVFPLLTEANVVENEVLGRHWKFDIWPRKLTIKKGGASIGIQSNEKSFLNEIL